MKKLMLKLWRIENVVLMKVLEQDESLRGKGHVFEKNGFGIISEGSPYFSDDTIFLRGRDDADDDYISRKLFANAQQAQNYIQTVIDTVRAYNASISPEPIAGDIETFIVE